MGIYFLEYDMEILVCLFILRGPRGGAISGEGIHGMFLAKLNPCL